MQTDEEMEGFTRMKTAFALKPRDYLATPEKKRFLNIALFSELSSRYGFITRILSFDRDRAWKRRLIDELPPQASPRCVDVACGTGDLTILLAQKYPNGRIIGLDLTEPMLSIARTRCRFPNVRFLSADMGRTLLDETSVDILTGGYALRNAGDLRQAIREIHRILVPGGMASFLDFSKPPQRFFQGLENLLLRIWGGFWGCVVHRNPDLYTYIADSLQQFPDRRNLKALFEAHGFQVVRSRLHFAGVIEAMTVVKSPP
ncbi:MAG: hypothetical protein A2X46_16920 [Lentisphaerae bacterium GWF2_57_35]|nr:MAG: hypothetical protein A2X46_16920 [Lentisphaerae bacterium GWF2_57_35]